MMMEAQWWPFWYCAQYLSGDHSSDLAPNIPSLIPPHYCPRWVGQAVVCDDRVPLFIIVWSVCGVTLPIPSPRDPSLTVSLVRKEATPFSLLFIHYCRRPNPLLLFTFPVTPSSLFIVIIHCYLLLPIPALCPSTLGRWVMEWRLETVVVTLIYLFLVSLDGWWRHSGVYSFPIRCLLPPTLHAPYSGSGEWISWRPQASLHAPVMVMVINGLTNMGGGTLHSPLRPVDLNLAPGKQNRWKFIYSLLLPLTSHCVCVVWSWHSHSSSYLFPSLFTTFGPYLLLLPLSPALPIPYLHWHVAISPIYVVDTGISFVVVICCPYISFDLNLFECRQVVIRIVGWWRYSDRLGYLTFDIPHIYISVVVIHLLLFVVVVLFPSL